MLEQCCYNSVVGQVAADFDWDDANARHLALHNVTQGEAEQAILDPHAALLEIQGGGNAERVKALGMTAAGRVLTVIFTFRGDAMRPITAYTASTRLQELYFKQRAT